jgi:hypothetical protein
MYQMRISTTKVLAVMLSPIKLEIPKNVKSVKELNKPNSVMKLCQNLSKDKAMHEEDNPSF